MEHCLQKPNGYCGLIDQKVTVKTKHIRGRFSFRNEGTWCLCNVDTENHDWWVKTNNYRLQKVKRRLNKKVKSETW